VQSLEIRRSILSHSQEERGDERVKDSSDSKAGGRPALGACQDWSLRSIIQSRRMPPTRKSIEFSRGVYVPFHGTLGRYVAIQMLTLSACRENQLLRSVTCLPLPLDKAQDSGARYPVIELKFMMLTHGNIIVAGSVMKPLALHTRRMRPCRTCYRIRNASVGISCSPCMMHFPLRQDCLVDMDI